MDFSIIILFKLDSEIRAQNLFRVLIYLRANFKDAEIIVVDQDSNSNQEFYDENFKNYDLENIRTISLDIPNPFYKSKLINTGIDESTNDVCVIYDCDVLIPKEQIEQAVEWCKDKYQFVYPYTNPQYNVPQEYFSEYHVEYDFNKMQYMLPIYQIQHRHQIDKYPVIAYGCGFCTVVNKKSLGKLVYYNEDFVGWGQEDSEYPYRMFLFNVKMTRVYGPIFHFEHPRNLQHKYLDYSERNRILYENLLLKKSKDELKEYYKKYGDMI